jgi:hypothetical protein
MTRRRALAQSVARDVFAGSAIGFLVLAVCCIASGFARGWSDASMVALGVCVISCAAAGALDN